MLLAGDHNMGRAATGTVPAPPQLFGNTLPLFQTVNGGESGGTQTGWADNGHAKSGNVLLGDGSVQGWSSSNLRIGLQNSGDVNHTDSINGFTTPGTNRLQFPF
jgi:prepilin-type processing-associated H-X9-DG protein